KSLGKVSFQKETRMRKTIPFLAAAVIAATALTGCAKVEKKFGRGISNTAEVVRMGELRRTMEQDALFESPDYTYTTGFVRGLNRSLARTGIGIYEVVTAPFPPYDPVATDYLAPGPVYPDNYAPGIVSDSMFDNDSYLGISGGEVLPIVPG